MNSCHLHVGPLRKEMGTSTRARLFEAALTYTGTDITLLGDGLKIFSRHVVRSTLLEDVAFAQNSKESWSKLRSARVLLYIN